MHFHHAHFWLLLVGVFLIALSAFGIQTPVLDLFKVGCGVCFLSFVDHH